MVRTNDVHINMAFHEPNPLFFLLILDKVTIFIFEVFFKWFLCLASNWDKMWFMLSLDDIVSID